MVAFTAGIGALAANLTIAATRTTPALDTWTALSDAEIPGMASGSDDTRMTADARRQMHGGR